MGKKLIKQDIHFLEHPLWLQDQEATCDLGNLEEGFLWHDLEGFSYRAGFKPPAKVDVIFLYGLLLHNQRTGWGREIELSRYELLKECGWVRLFCDDGECMLN